MTEEVIESENAQEDYLQFVAEGADTIQEVIIALRACAAYYEQKRDDGWRLAYPVASGHVQLGR